MTGLFLNYFFWRSNKISINKKSWDRWWGKSSSDLSDLSPYYFRRSMARKRRNKGSSGSGLTFPVLLIWLWPAFFEIDLVDAVGEPIEPRECSLSVTHRGGTVSIPPRHRNASWPTRRRRDCNGGCAKKGVGEMGHQGIDIIWKVVWHYNFLTEYIPVGSME